MTLKDILKGSWWAGLGLTFIAVRGIRSFHTPFHSKEWILSWLGFIRLVNPLKFYVPVYMWIFPGKRYIHFIQFSKGFMTEKRSGLDHLWYLWPDSISAFYSPRTIRDLNVWLLFHWAGRTVHKGTFLSPRACDYSQCCLGVFLSEMAVCEREASQKRKKSNVVSFRRKKKLLLLIISKTESDYLTSTMDVWGWTGLGDCSEREEESQSTTFPLSVSFLCVRKNALFIGLYL